MKILAIETSTEIASIALLADSDLRSVRLVSPPAHSATLLPAVKILLAESGVGFSALDAIAFGTGPGSFTGVRLACGVAQGLALGADLPVIPVSSLLALAQGSGAERAYCAMDARMNEAYVAAYERVGLAWEERIAPLCTAPHLAPEPPGDGWCGLGSAFRTYPELFVRLAARLRPVWADAVPTAHAVAQLAVGQTGIDPALAAPTYVRDRVALTVAERMAAGGRA